MLRFDTRVDLPRCPPEAPGTRLELLQELLDFGLGEGTDEVSDVFSISKRKNSRQTSDLQAKVR